MREKLCKWFNVDNIIDATVDLFLILFDVLSSPILIVMRLLRWIVGNYLLGGFKNKIKRLIHWTEGKHLLLQILVWTATICIAVIILTFMWLFGTAFGEFVMEEWGHQEIILD